MGPKMRYSTTDGNLKPQAVYVDDLPPRPQESDGFLLAQNHGLRVKSECRWSPIPMVEHPVRQSTASVVNAYYTLRLTHSLPPSVLSMLREVEDRSRLMPLEHVCIIGIGGGVPSARHAALRSRARAF